MAERPEQWAWQPANRCLVQWLAYWRNRWQVLWGLPLRVQALCLAACRRQWVPAAIFLSAEFLRRSSMAGRKLELEIDWKRVRAAMLPWAGRDGENSRRPEAT